MTRINSYVYAFPLTRLQCPSDENTPAGETMNEKMNAIPEWLRDMDGTNSPSRRTAGQEVVEQYIVNTHYRIADGGTVVKFPPKPGVHAIGGSRHMAMNGYMCTGWKPTGEPELNNSIAKEARAEIQNGYFSRSHDFTNQA